MHLCLYVIMCLQCVFSFLQYLTDSSEEVAVPLKLRLQVFCQAFMKGPVVIHLPEETPIKSPTGPVFAALVKRLNEVI